MKLIRSSPKKPEYWWFFSVEPYGPHANSRIDDTLLDSRAIGSMSYDKGLDGFEYFWATDWVKNANIRDVKWPEKASRWNLGLSGAGQLCYPSDDGLPMASLRLLNLRDGMEDWAALLMAGEQGRSVMPDDPRDPAALAAMRSQLYKILSQKCDYGK